jgi:hypothetical protein
VQVGQRALQPVADLDAHAPVVAGDEKQDAVILAGLAEAPVAEQAVGIGLDRLATEVGNGGDDDLVRRFLLEGGELLRQRGFGGRVDQVGVVDYPAGQRRQLLGKNGEGEEEEKEED